MKKIEFKQNFRNRLSEKLMELGNLILVTLVFGQFLSGKGFSLQAFITGIILTFTCYVISYFVS